MKKSKWILSLAILIIILSTFAACENIPSQHSEERGSEIDSAFSESITAECDHPTEVINHGIDPTCTENGITEGTHCSVCGDVLVEQEPISALGHKWGEWKVIERATTKRQGSRTHTCSTCNYVENKPIDIVTYKDELGSAGELSDTTLIVSIFADDKETKWDSNSEIDNETKALMLENLSIAVEWIKEQCDSYGVNSEFIFDWKNHSDLSYTFDFSDISLVRADGGGYATQHNYIDANIDSEELKQRYNAQNIFYIFYFNTDETNTINSWSLSSLQYCPIELINVFVRDDIGSSSHYFFMSPSGFAHEILHLFGARDLYYASETIPQPFVDYCYNTLSNDIMFTVSTEKEILQQFSELDAYYVGLADSCPLVDEWGLGTSSHNTEPK